MTWKAATSMGHFLALAVASHYVTKHLVFAVLGLTFFYEYGDLAACMSMHHICA